MLKFEKFKSSHKDMSIKEHINHYLNTAKTMKVKMTRETAKEMVNHERERIIWRNDIYEVFQYHGKLCDNMVQVPEYKGKCDWLSIKRIDKQPCNDWADFQKIKDDICGELREAIQIYPSSERLVDTANQYHLWVLPEGMAIPFGWFEGRVINDDSFDDEHLQTEQRLKYQ
mgnify:CR=1 FL=1|tara:strand:- start:556 stop:1068 length:513 start_codon:yes stop_codon:yes gene_type:complete